MCATVAIMKQQGLQEERHPGCPMWDPSFPGDMACQKQNCVLKPQTSLKTAAFTLFQCCSSLFLLEPETALTSQTSKAAIYPACNEISKFSLLLTHKTPQTVDDHFTSCLSPLLSRLPVLTSVLMIWSAYSIQGTLALGNIFDLFLWVTARVILFSNCVYTRPCLGELKLGLQDVTMFLGNRSISESLAYSILSGLQKVPGKLKFPDLTLPHP